VWVEGQVAEVTRRQGSGTVFLRLRDGAGEASIQLACKRTLYDSQTRPIIEGVGVVVCARPAFYVPRGTLSFDVSEFRLLGLGELLARIEALRQALAAEGLFAPERKRRLPMLPRRVGLVTASNSDAEHDVVVNARRRWPAVVFEFAYATMQGPRSAMEVTEALRRLDRHSEVDVIVIARGGGAFEDLLSFSDEALLRAVSAATTPVVSAIGHHADAPLLDLVADVRASTPTEAAGLVVPDVAQERRSILIDLERARAGLEAWLRHETQLLSDLRQRWARADPRRQLTAREEETRRLVDRARRSLRHRLERAGDDVRAHVGRARALSPLATLRRGYSVLQAADGTVIDSVSGRSPGEDVAVRLADGRLYATTTRVEEAPISPLTDG
jgi:exodeoxyribonuclease VII large subunit